MDSKPLFCPLTSLSAATAAGTEPPSPHSLPRRTPGPLTILRSTLPSSNPNVQNHTPASHNTMADRLHPVLNGADSHIRLLDQEPASGEEQFPVCKVAAHDRQRRFIKDEFEILRDLGLNAGLERKCYQGHQPRRQADYFCHCVNDGNGKREAGKN
ncbi:hypothetical protein QBC35DRAFT_216226 [Podospora australis]|uniref:Uncharacterized protein n=1 Tax=Podospora australis TaxID=1536484 RepID=A0AAN6WUY4_9PEZI|nr:hypothetical protein QBC35DRAFT_216226 [Podospora australis]